jgi:hypothetical protein
MMRTRKVWGVLGLLLALVVVVGYGQPQPLQPQPDPVAKLAAYPQELTSVLSQVVRQFTRVLGETQINISNAVMWIGRRDPVVIDSGVIIIAPPARLDLRPGAIVGLIGVHNVPLGPRLCGLATIRRSCHRIWCCLLEQRVSSYL